MKHQLLIQLLMLALMLPCLTACNNDDDEPMVAKYLEISRRLPIYYKLSGDNNLIPIPGDKANDEILLLNSADEVRSNIGEDFLQAYPDYLSVDFNHYSLVVKTSYKFPYVINPSESDFSIIYNPYRQCWQLNEEIYISDTLEDDFYVERVALVVEKIDNGTVITYVCQEKTEQDTDSDK